jgi:hypothetical protein
MSIVQLNRPYRVPPVSQDDEIKALEKQLLEQRLREAKLANRYLSFYMNRRVFRTLFFWGVVGLVVVSCTMKAPAQDATRSFYDRNGSYAGSTSTYNSGRNTTVTDRNGKFDGSVIRNSNGTTSFYDRNGHFTGSSTDTSRRR